MSKRSMVSMAKAATLGLAIFASAPGMAATNDRTAQLVPVSNVTSIPAPLLAQRAAVMNVSVRLTGQPLAAVAGSKRGGSLWSRSQQQAYVAQLKAAQDAVVAQVRALGGREVARLTKAHNAVIFEIDGRKVPQLMKIAGVAGVRRVVDYKLDLSETVPYIGAAAVQANGVDGSGITVAVHDSGIDFTHKNLGGPGTVAAFNDCYAQANVAPSGTCATLFGAGAPKVVGGFDFVGEAWPNGGLAADPNPIARLGTGGHGTHVADIIGGKSADGTRKGVAPGVKLLGVKVCSAVSSSCSGVALMQGMEFSLDPNGDNDISDAADIINMSLGSPYGQREDDLSAASAYATKLGVVVVVSAGNSGDRPYIAGSPSTTPEVISVAQTSVPSAKALALKVNTPANIAGQYTNTNTVDWAPVGAEVTGDVKTALQAGGANNLACALLPAGSLAGKVALIDRGTCNISFKVAYAANAGAIGVLLANNSAGAAPSFSYGGFPADVPQQILAPTLVIGQEIGTQLKNNLAGLNTTFSPNVFTPLVGSMASTSSRGPSHSYGAIKPEIGAPGASVSAEVGTGDGQTVFGGTSGAAPMVAGSAALLLQAKPTLKPHEVKAQLMNSAERQIFFNPATNPGLLAPISRIGAGEVRADKAVALTTGMWDAADPAGVALSFGAYRSTGVQTLYKKVLVRNYSNAARTYSIANSFRYADDQAGGAATISAPASVAVPANGSATFLVKLVLDANKAQAWTFANQGLRLGDGPRLNGPEIDGYLTLSQGNETVSLPWHILPHKVSNVVPAAQSLALDGAGQGVINLSNNGGAVTGAVDVYSLDASSPKLSPAVMPKPGDNFAIIDLKAVGTQLISVGGAPGVLFAVTTWGQRSHPSYPAEFDVYIDSDNDGDDDYVVYTVENTGFGATGQAVVAAVNLATNQGVIRFAAVTDLSSSNVIMPALLSDIGLTPNSKFRYTVYAFDNYHSNNPPTDVAGPATRTLDTPRFAPNASFLNVPINGAAQIGVTYNPAGDAASPSQSGLLLMYYEGKTGAEASEITVTPPAAP